jgi:hypothetical protein
MKMIKFLSSVVLGLGLSLSVCDADTIAVVPGTGGQQNNLWGGDATIGWQFTLASSITVTELGFFAPSNSLSDPHPVGIWDGSGTLLTSATVPAGAPVLLVDGFDFVPVTPIALGPGMYTIGAFGSGSSFDQFEFNKTNSSAISGLTLGSAYYIYSSTFTLPTILASQETQGYFGPDFMVAVPEPGSLGLLALGLLPVALRLAKRRSC